WSAPSAPCLSPDPAASFEATAQSPSPHSTHTHTRTLNQPLSNLSKYTNTNHPAHIRKPTHTESMACSLIHTKTLHTHTHTHSTHSTHTHTHTTPTHTLSTLSTHTHTHTHTHSVYDHAPHSCTSLPSLLLKPRLFFRHLMTSPLLQSLLHSLSASSCSPLW